jgi:hypothetical protein
MYGTIPSTEKHVEVMVDVFKAGPIVHEDDSKGEAVTTKPMEMPQDTHVGMFLVFSREC